MKKRLVTVMLVWSCIATPVLADFYGGMVDYSQKYATGRGGEFSIEPDTGFILSNAAYADSTKDQTVAGSFQSFCVEVTETIYDNSYVNVSETYVDGTPGSHAYAGGAAGDPDGPGDDLGSRTAYLYEQFALGALEGYVYESSGSYSVTFGTTNASFTRTETAGVLQRVLWALEDEGGTTWSSTFYNVSLDRSEEQALAAYWYETLVVPDDFGIGNVRVLQLYGSYDGSEFSDIRQDVLYLAPVPVPAAALLGLLGLSAAGIKLRRFA